MKKVFLLFGKTGLWVISSILISIPVLAQEAPITADGTTSTSVTTPDGSNFNINDGDKAGANLFHSFSNFSVPNGGSANFLNSPDIQNIISRVTGGNISNIEGLIKANGSANLFLINPAGIIFGPNASLSIGGSFLGSTANSLKFPDGEFIATNKEGNPLLTINAPIGLGIRDNPNAIVNNAGLQVNPGNNITLVGGNINLDSGKITSPAGRVELGSLASAGTVGLNPNGSLSFPNGTSRGDLTLNNGASVDVRAGGGGSIGVNAKNVNLSGESKLLAGIAENQGKLEAKAGDISIDATGSITLKELSQISNSTSGIGDAGTIKINASNNISVDGRVTDSLEDGSARSVPTSISSGIGPGIKGNAGIIDITTKNLSVTNSAQVGAVIQGEGNGGSVKINASDTLSIDGRVDGLSLTGEKQSFPSSIATEIEPTGKGNGGNVEITAKNLSLTNGGKISSSQVTEGQTGGNIILNVKDVLSLRGGSFISSQATGEASGGNIKIDAKDGFVVASPENNNDIVATAQQGEGGNININALAIYGFEKARIQTSLSAEERSNILKNAKNDINSTSDSSKTPSDRTLNVKTQTLDTSDRLPQNLIQPEQLVSQACSASATTAESINSFTIIGRGGMPADPTKPLNSMVMAGNLTAEEGGSEGGVEQWKQQEAINLTPKKKTFSSNEVIPARGMTVNEKGQVVLTRYPTPNASNSLRDSFASRSLTQSNYCSSSSTGKENLSESNLDKPLRSVAVKTSG